MTNPGRNIPMSPSSCPSLRIQTSWPGSVQRRSGDGFANTPTSAILTTLAGVASLGLKTVPLCTAGFLKLAHHHDVGACFQMGSYQKNPSRFSSHPTFAVGPARQAALTLWCKPHRNMAFLPVFVFSGGCRG